MREQSWYDEKAELKDEIHRLKSENQTQKLRIDDRKLQIPVI